MSVANLSHAVGAEDTLSAQAKAIADIAQGVAQIGNGLSAIGHGVAEVGRTLSPLQELVVTLNAALKEVQGRGQRLGGILGLLRLLRDKELQRTIHLLTVLPAVLDRLGARAASDPKEQP